MYHNSAVDGISRSFNSASKSSQAYIWIKLKFLFLKFIAAALCSSDEFTPPFYVKDEAFCCPFCDLLPFPEFGFFSLKTKAKYLSWNSGQATFARLHLKSSNNNKTDHQPSGPLLMLAFILCLATSCVFLSIVGLKDTASTISIIPFRNVGSVQSPVTQHVSLHFWMRQTPAVFHHVGSNPRFLVPLNSSDAFIGSAKESVFLVLFVSRITEETLGLHDIN